MDNSLTARVSRLLRRHRFAVLGYSAEDETYCPQCLRLSTGFSPHSIDTNGKPVLALYACDSTMHEEVCTSCHQKLVDLVPGLQPTLEFQVFRRVTTPESTIVRNVPAGTMRVHGDGHGFITLDETGETYSLFPGLAQEPSAERTVTAKPPVIRRRFVPAA